MSKLFSRRQKKSGVKRAKERSQFYGLIFCHTLFSFPHFQKERKIVKDSPLLASVPSSRSSIDSCAIVTPQNIFFLQGNNQRSFNLRFLTRALFVLILAHSLMLLEYSYVRLLSLWHIQYCYLSSELQQHTTVLFDNLVSTERFLSFFLCTQ